MNRFSDDDQNTKKIIYTAEKDHGYAVEVYKNFLESAERTINDFLTIKMSFMAFIGILFSIILSNKDEYTKIFLVILSIILFLTFLLLVDDLWSKFKRHEKSIKEQEAETILCSIRYSAAINFKNSTRESDKENFWNYGRDVENKINKNRKIVKLMGAGENIDNIVEQIREKRNWKLDFVLWAILFLFVPILFLLKFFSIL